MALQRSQRMVILTAIVGVLILGRGCAAVTGGNDAPVTELSAITVENSDDTAHTIHVAVASDSEPVYGTTVSLDAVSPAENESEFGSIDSVILADSAWTGKSRNWTIYTRVDETTSWRALTIPTTTEHDCHAVRLKIESDASVTGFTPDCESWPPSQS